MWLGVPWAFHPCLTAAAYGPEGRAGFRFGEAPGGECDHHGHPCRSGASGPATVPGSRCAGVGARPSAEVTGAAAFPWLLAGTGLTHRHHSPEVAGLCPASCARRHTGRPHRVCRCDFLRDSGKRYAVIPDEVEQAVREHAGLCIDIRADEILISADEHAQTSVSNMATATPLGPPGPRRRRSSTPGCSSWTRNQGSASLAPLAVTHRYNRTHCLWLGQFQIDARSGWQASRLCGSRRADHPAMGVVAGGRKVVSMACPP